MFPIVDINTIYAVGETMNGKLEFCVKCDKTQNILAFEYGDKDLHDAFAATPAVDGCSFHMVCCRTKMQISLQACYHLRLVSNLPYEQQSHIMPLKQRRSDLIQSPIRDGQDTTRNTM